MPPYAMCTEILVMDEWKQNDGDWWIERLFMAHIAFLLHLFCYVIIFADANVCHLKNE